MISFLPRTPGELHRLLGVWMVVAAILIGLLAGSVVYWVEARRVEETALQRAVQSVRHLESQAALLVMGTADDHGELSRLVGQGGIIGIRVFNAEKKSIYETWGDASPNLQLQVWSHQHAWPSTGKSHRKWSDLQDERMIQVVLPLVSQKGILIGYLETITRLDKGTLQSQTEQVRSSAITASITVLLTALLLYPLMLAMLRRSEGLTWQLLDSNLSLMRSLGNAIAKRDSDTDAHNYRVTFYAVSLAEAIRIPREEIADLVVGAFLHDIGKIGISDSILLKPGKLTDDEFEIMKAHVHLGIEIVADNHWLEGAATTILHHHERFNGNGYPDGLKGHAIPRVARIFAVADVFDALSSERPYKKAMPIDAALAIIQCESGQHFDPDMVSAFVQIVPHLYAELSGATEQALKTRMREMLERYFHTAELSKPA